MHTYAYNTYNTIHTMHYIQYIHTIHTIHAYNTCIQYMHKYNINADIYTYVHIYNTYAIALDSV